VAVVLVVFCLGVRSDGGADGRLAALRNDGRTYLTAKNTATSVTILSKDPMYIYNTEKEIKKD